MLTKQCREAVEALTIGAKDVYFYTDLNEDPEKIRAQMEPYGIYTMYLKHKIKGHSYFFYVDRAYGRMILESDAWQILVDESNKGSMSPKREADFHRSIGHLLGFPPVAIESFIARDKDRTTKSFGVRYCGIIFSADYHVLEESLEWLFDNKIPKNPYAFKLEITHLAESNLNVTVFDMFMKFNDRVPVKYIMKKVIQYA